MKELERREWRLRASGSSANGPSQVFETLSQETGLSRLTLKVCEQRGLDTAQAIRNFLSPQLENLKDPFSIRDMNLAVERVSDIREKGEKLRVFGDYDVDGTAGASLLTWIFRECGIQADVRQPDRFKDGYGLNVKAVEETAQAGIKVLMTVDCGISSFDAAERARELGIDLIIIDHHQIDPVRGLPPAYAVINPHRSDCESGLKQLCGCGLAFYFARALRTHGRALGWWVSGAEPNLKQHLDLVVLATAADLVPLTGDNHILVRHGLEVLKHTKKPGLKALLEVSGVASKNLSPSHLGFVLGPRINASGRMVSASIAHELLTTEDSVKASELAAQLEKLNKERAGVQNQIWDEVRARVDKGLEEGRFQHAIVLGDPSWHEGVVGIVASRVVETYRRPAAILAFREDFGKGSVRTYAGKDVLSALRACAPLLLGFGGHRHAAGLSVAPEQFENFVQAFDTAVGELQTDEDAKPLYLEGECSLVDLDLKTLQELEKLGPFGPGNPEPVFSFRATVKRYQVMKERHLKFQLSEKHTDPTAKTLEAVWFHAAQSCEESEMLYQESEWAGVPEINRFRGYVTPTIRIKDCRRGGE